MCFFFLFGDFFCFLFCILFFFWGGGWANLTLKSRITGFNFKTQNQPKKSTSKNRKSRLQNHLQNAIEQAPYKKHNFITEFIQAPNITTKFHRSPKKSPTKWLPQGSESSKRNCYKMTIFCWNSTRSCNWIFTANWLAHGHRFLQKHLYKQHCSEHKGPLSVGDISTHIFSEPICRWTAYDCLIALERRHLTHFIWQRVFGKTCVFRKTRVFTANPGFAGQTSVFVVNTGNFKGLEAQGIYTLTFWTLEISRVRVQTPGLPVTWGKIPGFSDKSRVCRKNPGFSLLCRNFQFFLEWGGRCLPICRIYWLFTYLRGSRNLNISLPNGDLWFRIALGNPITKFEPLSVRGTYFVRPPPRRPKKYCTYAEG